MTNKQQKDYRIEAHDFLSDMINDSTSKKNRQPSRPRGFVEIYEIDKKDKENQKLIGKSNLVLYQGREWLATRIFNLDNANLSTTKEEFICWFGVGDGGVTDLDPFDPISPTNEDTELNNSVMINYSNASYGDYRMLPDEGYYKHPFDSVEFEMDSVNDDRYLVLKVSTTLDEEDANDFILSEAGLYTSDSSDPGHTGPFHLYARITFPAIPKNTDRSILFVWYVFV